MWALAPEGTRSRITGNLKMFSCGGRCHSRNPRLEALTRLVADSLARHGLDRPVDPRRLQWSRWFRCDSPHSLLVVPSKPGIYALAEEIMDSGKGNTHVETTAPG